MERIKSLSAEVSVLVEAGRTQVSASSRVPRVGGDGKVAVIGHLEEERGV